MKKVLIASVIVAVVAVGAWAIYGNQANNQSQTNTAPTNTEESNPTQDKSDGKVNIDNMIFTPSQISVSKGDTVTWTNNDSVAHTVTDDLSDVGGPDSGSIEPGATYSFTFTKTGSFQYHCKLHTSMRATIVVN